MSKTQEASRDMDAAMQGESEQLRLELEELVGKYQQDLKRFAHWLLGKKYWFRHELSQSQVPDIIQALWTRLLANPQVLKQTLALRGEKDELGQVAVKKRLFHLTVQTMSNFARGYGRIEHGTGKGRKSGEYARSQDVMAPPRRDRISLETLKQLQLKSDSGEDAGESDLIDDFFAETESEQYNAALLEGLVADAEQEMFLALEKKERSEAVVKLLSRLTPREAEIIRLRFGLNEEGVEYTLQQLGEKYDVARARIQQIEAFALRKLRLVGRKVKIF